MTEKKDNFKYLVRIANTDLDGKKAIKRALTKINGVGFMMANFICSAASIPKAAITGSLSDAQVSRIEQVIRDPLSAGAPEWMLNRRKDIETGEDKHIILGDLKFQLENDIRNLKKIKSYKGLRHQWGLPVRGQNTKSNFRRSKRKKSMTTKRGKKPGAN